MEHVPTASRHLKEIENQSNNLTIKHFYVKYTVRGKKIDNISRYITHIMQLAV